MSYMHLAKLLNSPLSII
uniref:Uncharacterized protein n=1 Tax=Arundo donax TaxID=35708 RepID=A0A0A8ZNP8_ARUDO